MYVMASACILDPDLRSSVFLSDYDHALFFHAVRRCRDFQIEILPLPCPCNPARNQAKIRSDDIIKEKGPPRCIIGIEAPLPCGAAGLCCPDGVDGIKDLTFGLIPGIPRTDVRTFSKYRVYLAAPLFSAAEITFNREIANLLRERFFSVCLPQDSGDTHMGRSEEEQHTIFESNRKALDETDYVVAVIDGADADSGTSWEMGYAYAKKIPVIALRTDFREIGRNERVNLMLEQSAVVVRTPGAVLSVLLGWSSEALSGSSSSTSDQGGRG